MKGAVLERLSDLVSVRCEQGLIGVRGASEPGNTAMEVRIARAEFLRGLRLAQGIADRKAMMAVLANVLLRTQGKKRVTQIAPVVAAPPHSL